MAIVKKPYGVKPDGQAVTQYTMTNSSGASVSVIDFGGIVTSIIVPDRDGSMADVALGCANLEGYLGDHGCMGDTVGRYGNRIAKGRFTLDGVTYQLATNNGENHLHGGDVGFSQKMWAITPVEGNGQDSLKMHYVSPDGEENYPGTLDVTVTYTWDDDCNLIIRYEATTDKVLIIDADVITPAADSALIPTGSFMPVVGTPFDMRDGLLLGEGLDMTDSCPQMAAAGGYDHNFVLRKGAAMGMAACLFDDESGRMMEVITDQPGVQLYTACALNFADGKDGVSYGQYSGLCLETQHYPDTPNNPQFGSTVLRPGEKYDTTTIYAFRVAD